jgi:ABC-type nitrate/sulfonate/bicarbonate transport system permease component
VPATEAEKRLVRAAVARLRSGILALVTGLTAGSGLAFATAWLTLLGGEEVGPHLGLLEIFFPGYSVTWPGVFVGFAYGLLIGALVGGFTGVVYNRIIDWRDRRR